MNARLHELLFYTIYWHTVCQLQAAVLRTTSDACDTTTDSQKQRRERNERPYKSDPLSWSDTTADEKVGAPGECSFSC